MRPLGLEFYRIFNPYMALQEIPMYLGGVLGALSELIPAVSGKDVK